MAQHRNRSALRENLLVLAFSLGTAVLLLALAEAGLRLVGLGAPDASKTSRLKYQQISFPTLEPSTRPDGSEVLATWDVRLPYQAIERRKPPHALRVFAFGGSATAGLGYSPNVTFARHLERMLVRAYPARAVEVMNLGIVAMASQQVKLLVAEACREYEPDLVVIYSGNNEFLEIHAEKYARAESGWLSALRDQLAKTHLYRLLDRRLRGAAEAPSLADQNLSQEDLRLTQNRIIEKIEMSEDEIGEVVDRYQQNLVEMAVAVRESGTPAVLMTVASNWRWRGRSDLPDDWLDELVDGSGLAEAERYRLAREALTRKLETDPAPERHEWLFRRAIANEKLADFDAARDDYRAAMNEDPHLRRALDDMADRVREVSVQHGIFLLDTIEILAAGADHGIIGFEEFYDYVHFTPRGAVLVAAELFRAMQQLEVTPGIASFDPDGYVREQLERLQRLGQDALAVREWMGFGFDKSRLWDRDLWKYDQTLNELDELVQDDPSNVRALVFRGNARSFRQDGATAAAADYRAALQLAGEDPVIARNLAQLLAERVAAEGEGER